MLGYQARQRRSEDKLLTQRDLAIAAAELLAYTGNQLEDIDRLIMDFPAGAFTAARSAALRVLEPELGERETSRHAQELLARMPTTAMPSPAPLPKGSALLPFPPAHRFVGRDHLLITIARHMSSGSHVVLSGLAGTGKSLLASEFAHRYGQYFDGGVFWLNAESGRDLPDWVAACGGERGMGLGADFETLPPQTRVRLVLEQWRRLTPRLIILDNLTDPDLIEAVPTDGGCRLLITSQQRVSHPTLLMTPIDVHPLDRSASVELLRRLKPLHINVDEAILQVLAEEAGDIPLGLSLFGPLLSDIVDQELTTPTAVRAWLWARRDVGKLGHQAHPIDSTLRRLESDDPTGLTAREMLALSALFAPGEPIPRRILLAITANLDVGGEIPQRFRTAYQLLTHLHLLQIGASSLADSQSAIYLHRVVGARARDLFATLEHERHVEQMLHRYGVRLVEHDEDLKTLLPLIPQLRYITDRALARRELAGALQAMDLGWHLGLLEHHEDARHYARSSYETLCQIQGPTHPDSAEALCRLALVRQFANQNHEANLLWEQLLQIDSERLPVDSSALALTLCNVGIFLQIYGNYRQAEEYLQRSKHIRQQHLWRWLAEHKLAGPDQLPASEELRATRAEILADMARSARALGWLRTKEGRYTAAARYTRIALLTFQRAWGDTIKRMPVSQTYQNLGEIRYEQGRYAEAEEFVRKGRDLRHELYGKGRPIEQLLHVDIAESLRWMGLLAMQRGDLNGAKTLILQARMIVDQASTSHSLEMAYSTFALGQWHAVLSRMSRALAMYEAALSFHRSINRPQHPDVARILLAIGRVWLVDGQMTRAQQALEEGIEAIDGIFVVPHPLTGWLQAGLGDVALRQGKRFEARERYKRALAILQRRVPEHPDVGRYREQMQEVS